MSKSQALIILLVVTAGVAIGAFFILKPKLPWATNATIESSSEQMPVAEAPVADADMRDEGLVQDGIADEATLAQVKIDLTGVWKSTEDAKFTREFKADGKVIDRYEGEALATTEGTWELFTAVNAPVSMLNFQLNNHDIYIGMNMEGEAYHFRITSLSPVSLEVAYMERGNMLNFEKILTP